MFKRLFIVVFLFVALGVFLGFSFYRKVQMGKAMGAMMAPQPTAVSTLKVKPQSWQPS